LQKRIVAVFSVLCLALFGLYVRVGTLSASQALKEAALSQRSFTLTAGVRRGVIYDRNFKRLTSAAVSDETLFAVAPLPGNAAALLDAVPEEERASFYQKLSAGLPFLTDALPETFSAEGVTPLSVTGRYGSRQLAAHVIGYTDGSGKGVSGVEKAFDSLLSETGSVTTVRYTLDGLGTVLWDGSGTVSEEGDAAGVVLTLDREIQAVCETVGEEFIEKGAIVVMEPSSGKLLACASFPAFDPRDLSESLTASDAPLLNRCFAAFPVGSTFKTVLAAAALEEGWSVASPYTCKGALDVSGKLFRCHLLSGHGELSLRRAMIDSCNTYFIDLGRSLGAKRITSVAAGFSFGQPSDFAEGLSSGSGLLPEESDLRDPAALANLSFGQGTLLATPVQLCRMISSVVSGGRTPQAQLVEGLTRDGVTLSERVAPEAPSFVVSPETAAYLAEILTACVTEKEGMLAAPTRTTAAGKTGTAQTGQFDEAGKELLSTWFAGFFPAEEPRYAVTVLVENGTTGNKSAGPVFAEIADTLTLLDEIREETGKTQEGAGVS